MVQIRDPFPEVAGTRSARCGDPVGRYCCLLFGIGGEAARYWFGCGFRSAGALEVPSDQLDGVLRSPCGRRRVRTGGANGRPAGKLIVRWSMAGRAASGSAAGDSVPIMVG